MRGDGAQALSFAYGGRSFRSPCQTTIASGARQKRTHIRIQRPLGLGCAVCAAQRLRGGAAGVDDLDKPWLRIALLPSLVSHFLSVPLLPRRAEVTSVTSANRLDRARTPNDATRARLAASACRNCAAVKEFFGSRGSPSPSSISTTPSRRTREHLASVRRPTTN